MIGKKIRLERIINRNSHKTVIIPMDHGVTIGPVEGLIDMRETVSKVVAGGANAILMHKGLVQGGHRGHGKDIGLELLSRVLRQAGVTRAQWEKI